VTSSRELMTSSAAMLASQPAETDDVDDEVMTSSSRDADDNGEDDDSDDEDGVVRSPSAADMKQHVDLGPEVSTSGLVLPVFTLPVLPYDLLNRQSVENRLT